jgi:hypothetical protein
MQSDTAPGNGGTSAATALANKDVANQANYRISSRYAVTGGTRQRRCEIVGPTRGYVARTTCQRPGGPAAEAARISGGGQHDGPAASSAARTWLSVRRSRRMIGSGSGSPGLAPG